MKRYFALALCALLALGVLTFSAQPPEKFTAADFSARRDRALEKMEPGVAVVFGAKESHDMDDLAQDNYFYYLTGVETLDSILVLTKDAKGEAAEILLLPDHDPMWELWNGARLTANWCASPSSWTGDSAACCSARSAIQAPATLRRTAC